MTYSEIEKRLKKIDVALLKSNIKTCINEKYNYYGWRIDVVEKLNIKMGMFASMINPSHVGGVKFNHLMHIVNELGLDINKVLADGNVVRSAHSRYVKNPTATKWTDEVKRKFVKEYTNLNNSKSAIAEKYGLDKRSASTYCSQFKKGMVREL